MPNDLNRPGQWRAAAYRFAERYLRGHVVVGPITLYGANAMHYAINVETPWGQLCARPTTHGCAGLRRWYVYLSPDATPQNARWGIGPGFEP